MSDPAPRKSLKYIKDTVEYYPHQITGVRTLAKRSSFILADEMGLGKSLQALTVAAVDFEKGWAKRILIVCPASLKGNWEEETQEHTKFKPVVLDGSPKKRREKLAELKKDKDWNILIVNYEQVKPHLEELNALNAEVVVYDEAHMIKGHKAQRTKACHMLHGKRHFLLTGSPMLNHADDLWSLLYRVDPGAFPNYWRFVNRYCVFGGYKDKQIIGVKNEKELTERLDAYMLRRLKKDVLDLPEKQRIQVKVDLHPKQIELYKEVNEDLMLTMPDSPTPMDIENALTKMLRLKQICGTTATIEGYEDYSTKLDRALEMLEEMVLENGDHVVVFTQFRGVLKALMDRLDKAGIDQYALHGDVPKEKRQAVVRDWRENKNGGVMCAMLQVAGVGLNMTAANKAIFLDKLWVPKLNEQAEDRIHRIGASTTQPVQIYEMIARNTIEQRIETILRRKTKVFKAVVDTSDFKKKLIEALKTEEDV